MTNLTTAWGDLLEGFSWTIASTPTVKAPNTEHAGRRAVERHLRDLERRAQCKIQWFWVMEVSHAEHVHIHALLDAPFRPADVRLSWQGD